MTDKTITKRGVEWTKRENEREEEAKGWADSTHNREGGGGGGGGGGGWGGGGGGAIGQRGEKEEKEEREDGLRTHSKCRVRPGDETATGRVCKALPVGLSSSPL